MSKIQIYLNEILTSDRSFDYDEIFELLCENETEQFDLFIRLAYHLSELIETEQQAKSAARKIAQLAQDALEFNLYESDKEFNLCESDNLMSAAR